MGVHYALAFVLIIISCINAQQHVFFDETDSNMWDTDNQSPIFLDQSEHVIHRRDAPETDLEGSGLGENDQAPAIPELSTNNKTSNDLEKSPPEDNPVNEEPKKSDQISNSEKTNPAVTAEETLQSNDTQIESEQPNVEKLPPVESKTELPSPLTKSEIKGESEQAPPLPEVSSNDTASNDLENEASKSKDNPVNEVQEKSKEVVNPISSFAQASFAINADESNSTKTESEQPSADKDNVQTVESKPDLPNPVANSEVKEHNLAVDPVQSEPEPVEQVSEKISNETISPTRLPEIVKKENLVLPPLVHSISNETSEKAEPGTTTAPVTSAPNTDSPKVQEKVGGSVVNASNSENKESGNTKATPQVLPSDLAEDKPIDQKETESVNDNQSGNAVLFKGSRNDGASQVEGSESDKVLKGMEENAKISNEPTEQPATGQSAKNVSRAGKDTTILVVLFVVVIAIGGAAFTHNYIKKRKQNASANNDLVDGIRRSLQNLSSSNGKNNTDVEQGTELKPLMKENSPNLTKDYTESKKEVQA